MTGLIHLFWSTATRHGPVGVVLAWLALFGAAGVADAVFSWLTDRAASLAWAIRTRPDRPARVVALHRAHSDAQATDDGPARDRD